MFMCRNKKNNVDTPIIWSYDHIWSFQELYLLNYLPNVGFQVQNIAPDKTLFSNIKKILFSDFSIETYGMDIH